MIKIRNIILSAVLVVPLIISPFVPQEKDNSLVNAMMMSLSGYNAKGTAEFIDNDGTMITACHVAVTGVKKLCVMVGDTCYPAKVLAHNFQNDLAVIKIDLKYPHYLKISSVLPVVGQNFIKLGYPLNNVREFYPDVKYGKITAVDQMVRIWNYGVLNGMTVTTWVSNPGDSGGSILDRTDGLIGVVSAGSDQQSIQTGYLQLLKLLKDNNIPYETSTIWSKSLSTILNDGRKATKLVWLQVNE